MKIPGKFRIKQGLFHIPHSGIHAVKIHLNLPCVLPCTSLYQLIFQMRDEQGGVQMLIFLRNFFFCYCLREKKKQNSLLIVRPQATFVTGP